ncbi:MAG: metalloregulator ArsR/SmtB family transcription factor [Candidatus Aminicenantes bacterium]|nr:metalloregulator ArsR/SmtB family transcription factor [Candidatus Aminicenantes bacterium]
MKKKVARAQIVKIAKKLKALSHPERLRIVLELMKRECCVGELQKCVSLSQPHVSQSLRILKQAGIVIGRRRQRRVCYRVKDPVTEGMIKLFFEKSKAK